MLQRRGDGSGTRCAWRFPLVASIAAALLGCGDSVVVAPGPSPGEVAGATGGSRLRPEVAVAGDAAVFRGWWDSELGVRCGFRNAEGGGLRCMPTSWEVVFFDPGCTEPALLTRWCDPGRSDYGALRNNPSDPCDPSDAASDPPSSMYRRSGPPSEAQSAYSAHLEDGVLDCSDAAMPLAEGDALVPADPVAIERFVAASVAIEPGSGRLGTEVLRASDGAKEIRWGYDSELGSPCAASAHFAGTCVPGPGPSLGHLFADPGCSEPAMAQRCEPPVVGVRNDGCDLRLFARGAPVDAVFQDTGGGCETKDIGEGFAFTVGPELLAADFAAIEVVELGSGRVVSRHPTDAFGTPLGAGKLFDHELSVTSVVSELPDGRHAVVPGAWVHVPWFADASCQRPALVHDECSPPPAWIGRTTRAPGACSPTTFESVRPVGAEVTAAFEQTDDGCLPLDLDGNVAFELGAPLDPSTLPEGRFEIW